MRSNRIRIFVFLVLLLLAGLAAYRLSCSSCSKARRPNLILVSLDTLRADRLGAYGYKRDTTPFLDSLAAESVVFENTVAPSPWTLPSHVSMFSGLYAGSHGVDRPKVKIGAQTRLITQTLKEHGYTTIAYTGGGYVGKWFGFPRGFDEFHIDGEENRNGERSFAASLMWAGEKLKNLPRDKSFFLFLHTYAIHCPYRPAEPYLSMFNSQDAQRIHPGRCGTVYNKKGVNAAQALYISDRYDGSIRQVDGFLKSFFDGLRAEGVLDNTIVIITSDHGEEFLEHGRIGHQMSLFKELLMVPLIVSVPGLQGHRVSTPVSGVDLFPTVVELLGLSEKASVDGRSLVPLLHKKAGFGGLSYQYSELNRDMSLRSLLDPFGRHFIHNTETGESLLFDLLKDPGEQHNTAAQFPAEIEAFKSNLASVLSAAHRLEAEEINKESKEVMEQLKSLGYLN